MTNSIDPTKLGRVESNVQRALKPVSPPSAFRAHLRDGLVMAAQHQRAHSILADAADRREDYGWLVLLAAAILGAVLGFIAMRLRARWQAH